MGIRIFGWVLFAWATIGVAGGFLSVLDAPEALRNTMRLAAFIDVALAAIGLRLALKSRDRSVPPNSN